MLLYGYKPMSQKPQSNITYNSAIPATPLRFFWYLSKPYRWYALGAVIAAMLAAGLYQSTGLIFKHIVDYVDLDDTRQVLFFGLLLPVVLFFVQVFYRVSSLFAIEWLLKQEKKGYNELNAYVTLHSHGYFSDRFAGGLLSKIQNVTNALFNFGTDLLWTYLNAVTATAVTLILIARVDMHSALIFFALIVVLLVINIKLAPKKRLYSQMTAEHATKLKGRMVDLFSNVIAMRQYAARTNELEGIDGAIQKHQYWNKKAWIYSEIMVMTNVAILFVFSSAMFYLLAQRWMVGDVTSGEFILILTLVIQMSGTLTFLGRAFSNTARQMGEATEGLRDIIIAHEVADTSGAKQMVVNEGKIVWKDVRFTYHKNVVFNDLQLTIKPGQRVGLVGPSGAGKTTFVSLLLRQHDLTSGAILIDGQNIAEVTQDSLRSNIAVVPQEPALFHRSIRENIAYGKPGATDEEIIEVAKKAQAHDFIASLPEGYDTLVGERGVKLSGGQRQRVAIARAMLKNAPILILDEATSALDSESEVAIQKALHELVEGKTVVAIAHRLSTLREMDRILVLENGQIVEDGTHTELTKNKGTYAKLWEHQAGGFLQE